MDDRIREVLVQAIEEGVRRGVLRALQEAGWAPTTENRPGRLLTTEEAAQRLRVPRKAVYELVRVGLLPAVRIGHRLRVPESAVLAWEQGNGRPPANS